MDLDISGFNLNTKLIAESMFSECPQEMIIKLKHKKIKRKNLKI